MEQSNSFPRILILVFPFAAGNIYPVANKFATILAKISKQPILVGGNIPNNILWPENLLRRDIGFQLHYLRTIKPMLYSILLWLIKALFAQILMAYEVWLFRKKIDYIFCEMGVYYHLPVLLARLLSIKVVSASLGIYSTKAEISYGKYMASLIHVLSEIIFRFSDVIIVEGKHLAEHPSLQKFKDKLRNGALFLQNPENFQIRTRYEDRNLTIGFIGRLVKEKGIIEFIESIPQILKVYPNIQIMIIGSGILDDEVDERLGTINWKDKLIRIKWVDSALLPDYLNQLKLLIVPSYDEGLPGIITEAMGCGTPVLASSVGAIPDIILDNKTGFILKDQSPQSIADGVLRVFSHENISEIIQNASNLISEEYSLDSAIARYKLIFTV